MIWKIVQVIIRLVPCYNSQKNHVIFLIKNECGDDTYANHFANNVYSYLKHCLYEFLTLFSNQLNHLQPTSIFSYIFASKIDKHYYTYGFALMYTSILLYKAWFFKVAN